MYCLRSPGRFALFFAGLCAALLGSGCGPSTTDVSGKIVYNGQPLKKSGGKIIFKGPSKEVTADISETGEYKAIGVQRGENKVAVYYPNPKAQAGRGRGNVAEGGKTGEPESPFLTPAKYANPDTSELTVTVEKDAAYDPQLTGPDLK
jgi:hypothetical protein